MKKEGMNKAENWCERRAEYREIKRLATFKEHLGDDWHDTIDEEIGYVAIAVSR